MPIQRNSIREQIRDTLLERIAGGQLQPGDRVVEARLAEEMEVSPIPIREALRELEAMGVLESATHRGVWVREVSLSETMGAYEVKAALEALAARKAGSRLRGQCKALRKSVRAIVAAARKRDFDAFWRHNQVFHRTIVEAAGNEVLLKIWDSLGFQVRTRFTMDFLTSFDPVEIAKEHEPIIEAVEQGRTVEAAALLASHANGLVAYLSQQVEADRRSRQNG